MDGDKVVAVVVVVGMRMVAIVVVDRVVVVWRDHL